MFVRETAWFEFHHLVPLFATFVEFEEDFSLLFVLIKVWIRQKGLCHFHHVLVCCVVEVICHA